MNTFNNTIYATSTEKLIEDLKTKIWLAFSRCHISNKILLNSIDIIEQELVRRGYSWAEVEALEVQ